MFRLTLIIPFFCCLAVIAPASSQNQVVAQFVWHASEDGLNAISISDFSGELWSDPVKLYETEKVIASVAIGSDKLGNKLLVWTEQTKHKSLLVQKWFSAEGQKWGGDTLLSDLGTENIGATVVFDLDNRAWVFWSENGTGLSDIVGMYKDLGKPWVKPFQINRVNEVPDITPNASLNERGEVVVTWLTYSFDRNDYIETTKTVSAKAALQNDNAMELAYERSVIDGVSAPNFAPTHAFSLLHFPQNFMLKSVVVSASDKLKK